jgi:hypothetical protein
LSKTPALTGALFATSLLLAPLPASAVPVGLGAVPAPPATVEKAQIVNGRDYTNSPYVGRPVGPRFAPGPRYGGPPRFRGPGYGYRRGYAPRYGYGRPRFYGRRDYY